VGWPCGGVESAAGRGCCGAGWRAVGGAGESRAKRGRSLGGVRRRTSCGGAWVERSRAMQVSGGGAGGSRRRGSPLREWTVVAEQAGEQTRRERRGPAPTTPGVPERASSPSGRPEYEERDAIAVAPWLPQAHATHHEHQPVTRARVGPKRHTTHPATANRPSTQIAPASGPDVAIGVAKSRGMRSVCHADRSDNCRRFAGLRARCDTTEEAGLE
jgi:hypothetical protein